MKERDLYDFMDFKEAVNRVLKKWYEQRIQEETDKNKRLRTLHDNLTKIKILKEEETLKAYELSLQNEEDQQKERQILQSNDIEEVDTYHKYILERKDKLEAEMEDLKSQIRETQD